MASGGVVGRPGGDGKMTRMTVQIFDGRATAAATRPRLPACASPGERDVIPGPDAPPAGGAPGGHRHAGTVGGAGTGTGVGGGEPASWLIPDSGGPGPAARVMPRAGTAAHRVVPVAG